MTHVMPWRLTLDGELVVEIDYAEIRRRVAYVMCSVAYPGGAYDLPDVPRPLDKIAMAIPFNSTFPTGARYSLMRDPRLASCLTPKLFELVGKGAAKNPLARDAPPQA